MGEIVNVLVAFAVIVFIFRWATSNNDSPERQTAADALGFRPKPITQTMIDTIANMFPDIPVDNVRYDLMRTGSVEQTSNKILERGFLDAPPPAYYTLFPRENRTNNTANGNAARPAQPNAQDIGAPMKAPESLISRYNLHERVAKEESVGEEAGGKAVWEENAAKREQSLRERKAQMILAARQRMLAQQEQGQNGSAAKA